MVRTTSKASRSMTVQSLADVERFLSSHLMDRVDEHDQFVLAKCAAVVRVAAKRDEDERVLRDRADRETLGAVADAVRAYGTSEEVDQISHVEPEGY